MLQFPLLDGVWERPAIGAHDALALSQRSQLRGHIGPTRAPLVSVAHQRLLLGGVHVVEQQDVRVVATETLAKVGVVPPLEDHERVLAFVVKLDSILRAHRMVLGAGPEARGDTLLEDDWP